MDTGKKYHTIRTSVLEVGANSQGEVASKKVEDSAEMYSAATATRYNILFSQKWGITIPCNTSLEAGNTLKLEIESLAFCDKERGGDQKSNGKYIIESLCHYLDIEKSVTSMQLIRDSYGNFTAGEGDSKHSLLKSVGVVEESKSSNLYDQLSGFDGKKVEIKNAYGDDRYTGGLPGDAAVSENPDDFASWRTGK